MSRNGRALGLLVVALAVGAVQAEDPRPISFATEDGGLVHADVYGEGDRVVVLEGSAHAQFIFETDQAGRLMEEILHFLTEAQRSSPVNPSPGDHE